MIRRLKYHEIDFEKYEDCIENSVQKNFYAKKIILDHLCENWELLVEGDYQFVMPIPIKKKMKIPFVIMPLFLQQLGVFGRIDAASINQQFYHFLENNFRTVFYHFNAQNQFEIPVSLKKNYTILPTTYPLLRKSYFKGRKSTVKSAQHLTFQQLTFTPEILKYIEANFKGLEKKSDQLKFKNYLQFLNDKGFLMLFGGLHHQDIASLALIINTDEAYYLLGLVNNKNLKEHNGASFVIDAILKENIHQKPLNFMGGNIRGQEVFFKSFGAELQEYPLLQSSNKELITKIFIG